MKPLLISLLVALTNLANAQEGVKTSAGNTGRGNVIKQTKNTKTMEKQTMQVVHDFLTAVQQGNNEKLAALLHPDVTWSQPGKNRFAGKKTSRTEVFQMVGGMIEASTKSLQLTDVKSLSVNGDQVACLLHWKAVQPNGGVLDVDNIDMYTVKDGQIVSAVVFSADVAQEDEFWLH